MCWSWIDSSRNREAPAISCPGRGIVSVRRCTAGPGQKIAKTTPCKVEWTPAPGARCCAASGARDENAASSRRATGRHCERSEAIHSFFAGWHGLLRYARNDAARVPIDFKQQIHECDLARHELARGLRFVVPQTGGSRECRMRAASAVPCAKGRKKIAHEHTGQRRRSDIPCAMALRLTSCSPRSIGLSCLRRLPETGTQARLGFRASERLDADL